MAKIALLIGISEYGSGLNPLPNTLKDIEAMQQVLQPLEKAGFDEVKCLANPNPPMMREALETLFFNRHKQDLILLFFSGHVVQDHQNQLYFSTSVTCKTSRPELIRVSAIPASFIQNLINNSECQQVVLIVEGYLDNITIERINPSNAKFVDIQAELGGEGRVILSCFTSSQKAWEQENLNFNYSVYTNYLIEGMKTGIADLDNDGWITAHELHQYAIKKLEIAAPALKPEFYALEEGREILRLLAPTDQPKLQYHKEVEKWVSFGEIPLAGQYILDNLADSLSLTTEDCQAIKTVVLQPYKEYQEKLQCYQEEYKKAIANSYFLDMPERAKLKALQNSLGLTDENIISVEEQVALNREQRLLEKEEEHTLNRRQQSLEQEEDNTLDADQENELYTSQNDDENIIDSISITPETEVLPSQIEPILFVSQDKIEQPISDSSNLINSPVLPPSIVIPDTLITPNTDLVTTDSKTHYSKYLLPIGIGSILTTIAVVIAFSNRTSLTPTPVPTIKATTSEKLPTTTPSITPESKVCTVFVNGNLRSEPTYFKDNVIEALREPVLVTGKQTKGGWVEVKMPNDKLAWAYQDIIADKDRKEMNDCLKRKQKRITLIEDLLPPASNTSP